MRPAGNPVGQRLADPQVLPRGRILHVQDVCLFGLQVDLACQIAILLGFAGDELGELLRRAAKRHDVQPLPAFQQRWRLQRFDGSAMKFFHDGWRRTARRHQRKPVTVHETRQTAFAHRRQVGHRVEAFVRKHRQSLELPGADEIDHGLGDENEY